MFTGLSAFPLTPLIDGEIAEASFVSLREVRFTVLVGEVQALRLYDKDL